MTIATSVRPFEDLLACGVRVQVLDVSQTDAPADLATLSDEERERASRFEQPRDRAAFVAGRALVRRQLAAELGMEPRAVPLMVGLHGRPCFPAGLADDLDFNVTHSTTMVAVAVARGRRVGIDIEAVAQVRDLELLIQEVMGTDERARLGALFGVERVFAFYECWTRKEALLKAIGVGLGYPVRDIDLPILPFDGRVSLDHRDEFASFTREWNVWTTRLSEEFVLSVAVEGE